MRHGVFAAGLCLIALGAILFYMPLSVPAAGDIQADTAYRTQAVLPRQFAIATMLLGAVVALAGLLMGTSQTRIPSAPYDPERPRYSSYTGSKYLPRK